MKFDLKLFFVSLIFFFGNLSLAQQNSNSGRLLCIKSDGSGYDIFKATPKIDFDSKRTFVLSQKSNLPFYAHLKKQEIIFKKDSPSGNELKVYEIKSDFSLKFVKNVTLERNVPDLKKMIGLDGNLLFYMDDGSYQIYKVNDDYSLRLVNNGKGWRKYWKNIFPITFDRFKNEFIAFHDTKGEFQLYQEITADGIIGFGGRKPVEGKGWRTSWSSIVSNRVGKKSYIYFFDNADNRLEIYSSLLKTKGADVGRAFEDVVFGGNPNFLDWKIDRVSKVQYYDDYSNVFYVYPTK